VHPRMWDKGVAFFSENLGGEINISCCICVWEARTSIHPAHSSFCFISTPTFWWHV